MALFKVYKSDSCTYCQSAMQFLAALQTERSDVDVKLYDQQRDGAKVRAVMKRVGASTVPQIFVDGHHLGGWDQLAAWAGGGHLDHYLETGEFRRKKAGWFARLRGA